jgi:superfamily II DNA or RNA helicase/HKD family nuclease
MSIGRRGLYEALITEALEAQLRAAGDTLVPRREELRSADASDRIALHLARVVERSIAGIHERERVAKGIALARQLIQVIAATIKDAVATDAPIEAGEVLRSLATRLPDGTAEVLQEPLIPLLDTTLLTNSPGEPRVGHQILAEVHSAERIDVVMAFIRSTGINPLVDVLRRHCEAGRSLRVLTTTYTRSTEAHALDVLTDLGAEIRVSYDESTTRLHAKSWLFHREAGFSTAYVGSSNLTHSAQITGLEWNVRIAAARNPDVIGKMAAVFEGYWHSGDFVAYSREEFLARTVQVPKTSTFLLSPIELRPEPFQERLLEQISLSRERGHHRNLLVSATGTGKTVMAAVDYARLRTVLPRSRLLFVAHREEILAQSLATFRHAIREPSFGELWVGGQRPIHYEHVFASIQSLTSTGFADLDPAHFDVVIVDEFHHAAARSYQALLQHVAPRELLGLTATPERSDGLPLLNFFENRIAAELRLWDAIDQHRLSPFLYFGVHDGVDLSEVGWRRGRGYDVEGLSNLLTADDALARRILAQVSAHVSDMSAMKALGFCVSVEHARFMARVFNESNCPAVAVWADSSSEERKKALEDLAARRVNVVFSVDLFNEGIDVPSVDTLLLLRPTDSPTLFLQQLGRGLRKSLDKAACIVLDFVSHHRKEFRFDRRLGALLGGSRKALAEQIENGFPFLPAGCHMQLDRVAQDIVLRSIRESIPSGWTARVDELRRVSSEVSPLTLSAFLERSGLDIEDVYAGQRSWSELVEAADLSVAPSGPNEAILRRACGRLLHIDDPLRIDSYRKMLNQPSPPDPETLRVFDGRLLRMLTASVLDKALDKDDRLEHACRQLWAHPQVRAELLELLDVLTERVDHLQPTLSEHPDVPLRVHARYTRIEILAAFGVGDDAKVAPWQSGVYWAADAKADLFAFTLDKTSGQFSPTTRYRDYAISRDLIHWESQSSTRADSRTALRYRNHVAHGSSVMLFARLRTDDRAFWFLGPATYVRHESERPMQVVWKLTHPLPGDLFATFAAAVA